MHLIDWLVMLIPLTICAGIAIYSRRYVRSVADFMAGGRNAGRFLICAARSEQGAGAVVYVAMFQSFYVAGFVNGWWGQLSVPISLLVAITGFVVYRYRQTRALTLAQFFEMRYSKRFRLFTGFLGFFAGIVNFGIIPVLGAKFMVFFLELPQELHMGGHAVPTHLLLMAFFLTICVLTTTTGGQVSVLLTDCAEGMFSQIFYTLIAIALLIVFFNWHDTKTMLLDTEPNKSLVNPWDAWKVKDFNIWYVFMGIFGSLYRSIAWQNSHAFNSSAASPHESRMGGILGRWRGFASGVMVTLLAVCAMTYIKSPAGSEAVNAALSGITDPSTRDQMRVPVALSQFLPIGIKGALISICLMGIIAGDGIHLHSWGSIFIQDVVIPLRKGKPLSTNQHLLLLRLAVVGVAVWAFAFGALFPQTKYVMFWWAITEAIFIGGAGVAVIGGLYWSRGTTPGAWTGLIIGSTLAMSGIVLELFIQRVPYETLTWMHNLLRAVYLEHPLPDGKVEFLLNGAQVSFFSALAAISSYAVVSLLTCKAPHDMDRLLNRGKYAVEPEGSGGAGVGKPVNALYRLVGIDEQFSRSDRWITLGIFWWSMFWFAVFVVGSIGYVIIRQGRTDSEFNGMWATYWLITGIYLPVLIGLATTVWFTIGCWHDMWEFFKRLSEERVNEEDDGSVHSEHPVEATAGAPAEKGDKSNALSQH